MPDRAEPRLYRLNVAICEPCLRGVGSQCHNGGCAFCWHDVPGTSPSLWDSWNDVPGALEPELSQVDRIRHAIQDLSDPVGVLDRIRKSLDEDPNICVENERSSREGGE